MNDWDNRNNLPSDDDDNDDLSWLEGDNDDLGWQADADDFDLFADEADNDEASAEDDLSWQADDDDDDDFDLFADDSWSNDDDDDFDLFADETDASDTPDEWQMPRTDRAERDIAAQMEDAEAADFGDTDEMLDWMASDSDAELLDAEPSAEDASATDEGLDLPDWLSGMDIPDASDEAVAAARADVSDDADDGFGDFDDGDADDIWGTASSFDDVADSDDDGWGDLDDDADADADDLWGVSASDSDDSATDDEGWGTAFSSDDDDDGIGESELGWLDGESVSDDEEIRIDDADDFAAFMPDASDSAEDADDELAWLGASDSATDDTDDFAAFMPDASDSAEDVTDFDTFMSDATGNTTEFDALMPDADASDDAAEADDSADEDDLGWFASNDDSLEDGWGEMVELTEDADTEDAGFGDFAVEDDDFVGLGSADDDSVPTPPWLASAESTPSDGDDEFDSIFAALDTGETYAVQDDDAEDEMDEFDNLIANLDTGALRDLSAEDIEDDDLATLFAEADETDVDSADLNDLIAELDTGGVDDADANLDDLLSQLDVDTTDDASAEDLDDLLGMLDTDDSTDADAEFERLDAVSEIDTGDLDFVSELDDDEDSIDTGELDFLAELSGAEPDADLMQEDEESAEQDFFADFETDDVDLDDDLFGDFDDSEAEPAELNEGWFSEDFGADNVITDDDEDSAAVAASVDDAPDWLDEISGIDTGALAEAARSTNEMQQVDVDALIDSFGDGDTGDLDPAAVSSANLGAVLAQLDDEQRSQLPDDLNADELPDWLRELATNTDADSAVAVIRERRDRSLDDLDDRLRDLHERGLELTPDTTQTAEDKERLAKIVPNIDEVLTPAAITPGQTSLATDPIVSPDQAERIALIQSLVGSAVSTDTETDTSSRPREIFHFVYNRLDRVLVGLILLLAVLLPFTNANFGTVGTLPPGEFATESAEFAAFALIEDTDPEDFVLIAAEYGATGARELDDATRIFMEHVITNGGTPVIVSSNAIGILRAENIVAGLLGEDGVNEDYYVGGFLPGGAIGLRDFVQSVSSVLATDVRGDATGLPLTSLEDFSSIVLISESGEVVRNWMEQVAPSTDTSIVVVTGQAARPLALPYVSAVDNAVALLVGYEDAFTYQQMVLGVYNPSPTPSPTETVTSTPTNTSEPTATELPSETPAPTDTPVPTNTAEPTEEVDEDASAVVADDDETDATDEPEEPDETEVVADETEAPAEPTATDSPTDTPEPTLSPTPNTIVAVRVIAADGVNVRAGAGSAFALVGNADPGDILRLNNENTLDDDWINIQLPDGTEGWVASFLVEVVEIEDTDLDSETVDTVQIGTIVGDGRVNVRSGAGSEFPSVAGLDVGTEVRVLGESANGEWVNVVLPNGTEGWVANFLIVIEERPADEWDGARRDGFYPLYFNRPPDIRQDDDAEVPTVTIGTNVSGLVMSVYDEVELITEISTVNPLGQVLVLDELPEEDASFVQLENGLQGYVESRLLRIEDVAIDTVDFVPTATPTPSSTPTPTVTPSPTAFVPQLTPAPPSTNQSVRVSSQALGLVVAISIIALGNLFWVFRSLRRGDA